LSINDRYKIFDSQDLHINLHSISTTRSQLAICGIITSQEAYIDEWVDYHLALGTSMYLYDSSDEFWMRQWGSTRGENRLITVTHFPGDVSDHSFVAKAYSNCLAANLNSHETIALMEVNDFLLPSDQSRLRSGASNCISKVRRVLFGNDDKSVYDPIPVTKRFQRRVAEHDLHPLLLVPSSMSKDDLLVYLTVGNVNETYCSKESTDLVSYHYIRSIKECRQQRGDVELCHLSGDIRDTSGWDRVQHVLPAYIEFNAFI
jgi:hypothetical protein